MSAIGQGRGHAEASASITAAEVAATLTGLPGGGAIAAQVVASAISATITFEVTVNGSDWASIELMNSTDLTDTSLSATTTAAGVFVGKMPLGVSGFRARCSAFSSATAASVTVRWARA